MNNAMFTDFWLQERTVHMSGGFSVVDLKELEALFFNHLEQRLA